jgi:hypothetical protein
MARKNSTKPRITVFADDADEARKLFAQAGFDPIEESQSEAGFVTFIFAPPPDDQMLKLLSAIPRDMYAHQGVVLSKLPLGN